MNDYAPNVLDAVLDRQKRAWVDGSRPAVEDFLRDSSFQTDSEALLDLIYNEVLAREEIGEKPSQEEYIQRYPHLAEDLKLHFEVHRAVNDKFLVATNCLHNSGTLTDASSPSVGHGPTLDDYEILGELGQGGMGIVYKARHRRLKRLVALKMIHPGRIPSDRALERFRGEAETIARLQHPNIVQIFEVGQSQGLPFLALELAEGGTLEKKLRELPFTARPAAELIETLARAIHHAHQQHIVHRDLKPANVLFAKDGTAKITDFGLAKVLADDPQAPRDPTRTGEPIGTPRYMSPEQVAGQIDQIGPATDVYALGALLYECLTDQAPFLAPKVMETMDKIRRDDPVPPRRLQPAIPRDLETICLHCLQKQPARRYATALDLAQDLHRFLQGEPIHARPTPRWERIWKWARRRPAQAVLAGSVGVLILTSLTFLGVRNQLERERLADLRSEVAELVKKGKEAWDRKDLRTAQARFLDAWSKVLAEPALHDHVSSVFGWLDHSRRAAEKERWKERSPPLEFDVLRDEAFLQWVVLDPHTPESVRTARQAVKSALTLTLHDDAVYRLDREQLILLDADLVLRQGNPAQALELLDQLKGVSSRLWHNRRADCLARLDRKPEADRERIEAEKIPPQESLGLFLSGVDRFHQQDLAGAARDFDKVLALEPEDFAARFFQAVCFLRLKRPGEAKVALTACLGQRPRFAWSYLYRGLASLQMGNQASAAQDVQRALKMNPHEWANMPQPQRVRFQELYLGQALGILNEALESMPVSIREPFWREMNQTQPGLQQLRGFPAFQKLEKLMAEKNTAPK